MAGAGAVGMRGPAPRCCAAALCPACPASQPPCSTLLFMPAATCMRYDTTDGSPAAPPMHLPWAGTAMPCHSTRATHEPQPVAACAEVQAHCHQSLCSQSSLVPMLWGGWARPACLVSCPAPAPPRARQPNPPYSCALKPPTSRTASPPHRPPSQQHACRDDYFIAKSRQIALTAAALLHPHPPPLLRAPYRSVL